MGGRVGGGRMGGRVGGGGSSPFVVVGAQLVVTILIVRHHRLLLSFSNIVRPRYLLLVVGGILIACQWWWPFLIECGGEVVVCICRHLSSFLGGWDGRSSSPVGLPGLWAIILWLFGGLLFIGSGGERCLYVVSSDGCC